LNSEQLRIAAVERILREELHFLFISRWPSFPASRNAAQFETGPHKKTLQFIHLPGAETD
jgi:hypothetical protein